jgi:hypothetical protein
MDEERYYWYSEKQRKTCLNFSRMEDTDHFQTFGIIKGKTVEYTEAMDKGETSNWDDVIFLGVGVYSHSVKT